ncbi:MAG TPA: GNAT family N-acetyltransferase [Mycobacteriales bacterium]|nr:GNAT family N-acetyltransferase [Mycobacteriales bacterium]
MTAADVEETVRIQIDAFAALGRRRGDEPEAITDRMLERARLRHDHFVTHDPDGAFVATIEDKVVGCALALRRERLWGLSLLVVAPATQSSGAGRKLLDAALAYGEGCARGVILSSSDPRAIRSYATSGFQLFPQVSASGSPAMAGRPTLDRRVRTGSATDRELADDVDRDVRGAGRGPDHEVVAAVGAQMYVVDDARGRGYAYLRDGGVYLLAASDDATAAALLWRCLEHVHDTGTKATVDHITAEQQWAVEACFAARLKVVPDGPVFWRGATPPCAYLPSGAFL